MKTWFKKCRILLPRNGINNCLLCNKDLSYIGGRKQGKCLSNAKIFDLFRTKHILLSSNHFVCNDRHQISIDNLPTLDIKDIHHQYNLLSFHRSIQLLGYQLSKLNNDDNNNVCRNYNIASSELRPGLITTQSPTTHPTNAPIPMTATLPGQLSTMPATLPGQLPSRIPIMSMPITISNNSAQMTLAASNAGNVRRGARQPAIPTIPRAPPKPPPPTGPPSPSPSPPARPPPPTASRRRRIPRNIPFINYHNSDDKRIKKFTRLSRDNMQDLSRLSGVTLNDLFVFYTRLYRHSAYEFGESIFGMPKATMSRHNKQCIRSLVEQLVEVELNEAWSRERIDANTPLHIKKLFNMKPGQILLTTDGTRMAVERSGDYAIQRRDYFGKKDRNMLNWMPILCANGRYVLDIGPFNGNSSDTTIYEIMTDLDYLQKSLHDQMTNPQADLSKHIFDIDQLNLLIWFNTKIFLPGIRFNTLDFNH